MTRGKPKTSDLPAVFSSAGGFSAQPSADAAVSSRPIEEQGAAMIDAGSPPVRNSC